MKYFLSLFFLACVFHCPAQVLRQRAVTLMGSRWEITIVAADSAIAVNHIDTVIAEVRRIEYLISDWKPETQISQVNNMAGIAPVKVDREVFELTKRGLKLSQFTHGAFDISFAAMDRIWKFDGSMTQMPSPEAIKKSVEKVGYQNILLDSVACTIFLKNRGMKIGFGALGEGYAADRCRQLMQSKGIEAGIVNGSGDMSVWGQHPDGHPWTIGIADPENSTELYAVVPLLQASVVTSGSYEKYVVFNGKRYGHIINPATGYPATGITAVTVFGTSAEVANGISTSIMVLGKKAGLKLLKQFPGYQCLMMDDNGKVFTSPNLSRKQLREWRKWD